MVEKLPFKEKKINNWYIRTFPNIVKDDDLKWHWDDEHRLVVPLHENNWMIQLDDELPQLLEEPLFIKKGEMHRLIRGNGDLKLKVKKY